MKSICVLGVYFGSLKNYFSLFLKSCGSNQKIDFLIFTDQSLRGGEFAKECKDNKSQSVYTKRACY